MALRGNKKRFPNFSVDNNFFTARVLDVSINENSPLWKTNAEWNSIGLIECELLNDDGRLTTLRAKPYFPFLRYYPLVGELVYLLLLPAYNAENIKENSFSYYYLPTLNIWNSFQYNGAPNQDAYNPKPASSNVNYTEAFLGIERFTSDTTTPQKPFNPNPSNNNTFIEKDNLRPLYYFPGDLIFEGRFGNSIRLGNTSKVSTKDKGLLNTWSETGNNSDPITIINNGQRAKESNKFNEPWVPYSENAEDDISSIYLTSTQKLPIVPNNPLISSTSIKPTALSTYAGPQVLLNSNRLVLNAKTDSIIIAGAQTVNISSKQVGIRGEQNIVLNSGTILLGNRAAQEPLLKGAQTVELLKDLLVGLKYAFSQFQDITNWPGGQPAPNVAAINASIDMVSQIEEIENNYLGDNPSILSKTCKTI